MNLILVNQSKVRMPRKALHETVRFIQKKLSKYNLKSKDLTIVFIDPGTAKKMNHQFRGRNYATDVLSFEGEDDSLGELVLCPQVLKKQAHDHDLSFHQELAYMIIHGVLHLLGYDHEESEKQARVMFKIQDRLFDQYLIAANK